MTSKIREAIKHLNEDKMTWLRLSKQKKLRRLALAEYRSDVKLIKKLKRR